MNKKFNTVEMVRKIRDDIYEEIKNMSTEDKVKYFNENGKKAEKELKKKMVNTQSVNR